MPVWLFLVFVSLVAFTGYEVWLAQTKGRIFIGLAGEVSRADAPLMFAIYRAGCWIGLILSSVLTLMFLFAFGVKT